MNKMNKKGFTLIEMLVVIAIIAVLVSIIIPTVANSTKKAAAAADAANLRSVLAEVTAAYLTGEKVTTGTGTAASTTITTANVTLTIGSAGKPTAISVNANAPVCKSDDTLKLKVIYRDAVDGFEIAFGDYGVKAFAEIAEKGTDMDKLDATLKVAEKGAKDVVGSAT